MHMKNSINFTVNVQLQYNLDELNGKTKGKCQSDEVWSVAMFFFSSTSASEFRLWYILFNNLNSDKSKSGANETDLCVNDAFNA